MRFASRVLVSTLFSALLALAACSSPTSHERDAGDGTDAALHEDGSTMDASAPSDGGANDGPGADAAPRDLGPLPDAYVPDASANLAWLDEEFCDSVMEALCDARASCACGDDSIEMCRAAFGSSDCVPYEFREGVARAHIDINIEELSAITGYVTALAGSCRGPSFVEQAMYRSFFLPVAVGDRCPGESDYLACARGDGTCVDGVCLESGAEGARCDFGCKTGLFCNDEGRCEGLIAAGEPCSTSRDCAPETVCSAGVCTVSRSTGGACGDEAPCGEGLRCVSGVCTARAASCESESDCRDGESCTGDYVSECRPRGMLGDRCTYISECAPGLGCILDEFAWEGECGVLPTGVGESCERSSFCGDGLMCDYETRTCNRLPGLGEECRFGDVPDARRSTGCEAGLGCVRGICQPVPGIGETCTEDGFCAEGSACEYDWRMGTAYCVAPRGEGEVCFGDEACEGPFLFCLWGDSGEGVCTRRYGLGEECSYNECQDGLTCILDESDPWRGRGSCLPIPSLGESCNGVCGADLHCASFLRDAFCTSSLCGGGDRVEPSPGPLPGPLPEPVPL